MFVILLSIKFRIAYLCETPNLLVKKQWTSVAWPENQFERSWREILNIYYYHWHWTCLYYSFPLRTVVSLWTVVCREYSNKIFKFIWNLRNLDFFKTVVLSVYCLWLQSFDVEARQLTINQRETCKNIFHELESVMQKYYSV